MSFNDLEQGYGTSGTSRGNRFGSNALSDEDADYIQRTKGVSQMISTLAGNIQSMDKLLKILDTSKDPTDILDKLHNVTESTRELVKKATQEITALSQYQAKDTSKVRQRKLEQQKLSKDFKKVLGDFQSVQQKSAVKQRNFIDKAKAKHAALESEIAMEQDEEQHQRQVQANYQNETQRRIQLQSLDHEIEYNETLINEREGEILEIERGITELNEIFRDLGSLVNEQESGVQSIYGNVVNIAQNTRQAADELVIANRHQKSARKNMCCLLLIITVVACCLALIVVVAK